MGPLLFLILINDLSDCVRNSYCQIFADDFKLYKPISTVDDCLNLQKDLDRVVEWTKKNNLSLNISKCSCMTYSRKQQGIIYNYTIEGKCLNRVTTTRDLGILFDDKLTFNEHVLQCVKKSYQMLGFILRNSANFNNINSFIYLYNTYVRCHLEYGSIIWSPYYDYYKNEVEKVQKKLLRYLYYKRHGVYPSTRPYILMLEEFNFHTLEQRRYIATAVYLYKIVNSLVDSPQLLQLLMFNIPSYAHRSVLTFCIPPRRTNYIVNSPVYRMMDITNTFKKLDIFCISINQLKTQAMEILNARV